ncbi:conjugal transfer protein TraI [Amycolatopsis sp. NPDC001319]|uniref:conjugal transfer protein TraI n=1 Tax=unclassified Amycolatopsis TaxID=2618356 RepID=UPI00368AF1B9
MTTTTEHLDDGEPGGEFSHGLAALERHLAEVADAETIGPDEDGTTSPDPRETTSAGRAGVTRRVKRRVAEHEEAHRLLVLEADTAPFEVTTDKVRTRRKAVNEAAALWQLSRDPRVLAYRDARMLRLIIGVALVSLVLALAWSTAGVQAFAAEGNPPWSPQWCFAWLAEPFCSLALLMVVAGRAYLTTRGQPLRSGSVERTEWVFLGLTLGMNAWPHLPGVAQDFTVSSLVLHLLGPVVAVAVVRCLPHLLAAFSTLDVNPDTPTEPTPTTTTPASVAAVADPAPAVDPPAAPAPRRIAPARRPGGRKTVRSTIPEPKRRGLDELREEFKALLKNPPPGFRPDVIGDIREALHCGQKYAVALRNEYKNRPTD